MKIILTLFFITLSVLSFAQKDKIIVKEASFRYECQEQVLEKYEEKILVRIAYSGNYKITHESVTETIEIKPEVIECIITAPVYKTVTITEKRDGKTISYEKQVLVKPATIERKTIPPVYGTVTKYVMLNSQKTTEFIEEPNQYITIEKWREVQKATAKRIDIPAEYKVIE